MELKDLVDRFQSNLRYRLEEMSRDSGNTQAFILGQVGLNKGTLWAMKGRRPDPRLSTLMKLSQSVGAMTPEEFATFFYVSMLEKSK
jgi:DNA-binding XRE family transcriptional regulator